MTVTARELAELVGSVALGMVLGFISGVMGYFVIPMWVNTLSWGKITVSLTVSPWELGLTTAILTGAWYSILMVPTLIVIVGEWVARRRRAL